MSEAISVEIDTTIRQFINETVASFMEEQRNETILNILLNEILLEMDLADGSMEELIIYDFMEQLIDMEILVIVQNLLFALSFETKLLVYTRPRSLPKSKKVDLLMEKILDKIIFRLILEYKTNDQLSGVENKMDQILDMILANCIIHQLSK